jgi:hypothetical protein
MVSGVWPGKKQHGRQASVGILDCLRELVFPSDCGEENANMPPNVGVLLTRSQLDTIASPAG